MSKSQSRQLSYLSFMSMNHIYVFRQVSKFKECFNIPFYILKSCLSTPNTTHAMHYQFSKSYKNKCRVSRRCYTLTQAEMKTKMQCAMLNTELGMLIDDKCDTHPVIVHSLVYTSGLRMRNAEIKTRGKIVCATI